LVGNIKASTFAPALRD